MDEQNDTTDYSQGKIYKIVCNKNQLVNTSFVSDKRDINKYYDKLRNSVEK